MIVPIAIAPMIAPAAVMAIPIVAIPPAAAIPVPIAMPADHDRRRSRRIDDGRRRGRVDGSGRDVHRRRHTDIHTDVHARHCRAGSADRKCADKTGNEACRLGHDRLLSIENRSTGSRPVLDGIEYTPWMLCRYFILVTVAARYSVRRGPSRGQFRPRRSGDRAARARIAAHARRTTSTVARAGVATASASRNRSRAQARTA